jgi:hypothetical protein
LAFHPYAQLIQRLFNVYWFGPSRIATRASAWPCVDHSASGLQSATQIARLRLAFAPAPRHRRLTLLRSSNSPVHYAKGTPSGRNEPKLEQALRPLVGTRFQVLFHSPPGVLFTFPSRYWFTIGRQRILSLERWSSRIPTGFLVSRSTWVSIPGSPRPFA